MIGTAAQLLLVQLSDGEHWLVEADSGKRLPGRKGSDRTARVAWRLPPAEVKPGLVAISDGPGTIHLLDLAGGKVVWTHEVDGESSLAGPPPQVKPDRDALLIAVERNHGFELDRLDPVDGTSLWPSGPAFLDASDINLAHADCDEEQIVVPAGRSARLNLPQEREMLVGNQTARCPRSQPMGRPRGPACRDRLYRVGTPA